jgi:HAD superfamily hydrolase (TIGR01450 family)
MTSPPPRRITLDALVARHEAIFLDAYGVLVDGDGAIAGAREGLAHLERTNARWFVMTNDASRTRESMAARFHSLGLEVSPEHIVASMDAFPALVDRLGMRGARTVVLGESDSHRITRDAGMSLVDPLATLDWDVLVLADQTGFPMLETFDRVVSGLLRAIDRGRSPVLVLPNPDRIYPKRDGEYGVASGSLAALVDAAIAVRGERAKRLGWHTLGKPHAPIFEEACRRAGTRNAVLVGDQLLTDVRGANAFGIASAIVETGITKSSDLVGVDDSIRPTYLLANLA